MRGDRWRIALSDLLFDRAATRGTRLGGDIPVRAGVRLERVPAGAVSFRCQGTDAALRDLLAECYSRTTMVEYVDADYDSAGDRHGDRAGALHLARPAGGCGEGLGRRLETGSWRLEARISQSLVSNL